MSRYRQTMPLFPLPLDWRLPTVPSERRSAGRILWRGNRQAWPPARHHFVPCDHQYLNFKDSKLSKSRGAFVEVPYFLSKYDPDALRQPMPTFKKLDESVVG